MNNHNYKKVAPAIITTLLLLYYVLYFILLKSVMSDIVAMVVGVLVAIIGIASIYVCAKRMKEIDNGEEDDLSQY